VSDAALLLSVLAQQPTMAQIRGAANLRIATSVKLPTGTGPIPKQFATAVTRTGQLLAAAGHRVEEAHPRYGNIGAALLAHWLASPGQTDVALDWRQLEQRTRRHLRAASMVRRMGLAHNEARRKWALRAQQFFTRYDLLITPMLATMPPRAVLWREKGWLANAIPAARLTAYLGPWDIAGFPAMSVPAGHHNSGLPIGIQIVAPPRCESRLLSLAAQLEALNPWPRAAV
jgi:amidase